MILPLRCRTDKLSIWTIYRFYPGLWFRSLLSLFKAAVLSVAVVGAICLTICRGQAAEPLVFESGPTAATVVELFTSEGCSSCPPAEKWFSRFKTDPNLWKTIVPAAFHVDYWDRIGWKDRFAKPQFTERQQRYSAAWNAESVYTPGFVVNGSEWKGWFNGSALPQRSDRAGNLRLVISGDNRLTGTFKPEQSSTKGFNLEAALVGSDLESNVSRGENSGRKLRHDFVVLQFANGAMKLEDNQWTGAIAFPETSSDAPAAVVAWVVPTDSHQPIQATGGWLKKQP